MAKQAMVFCPVLRSRILWGIGKQLDTISWVQYCQRIFTIQCVKVLSKAKVPVLLKGVLHPDDARLAIDHGAAGVIVSNHGARQLDTVPATIEALPEIVEAVGDKIEVLIDGGIRRGTDIVKAIALGAKGVGVGRPIIWGLAVNGEQGATRILSILRKDFELAMRLCGCTTIDEIQKALVG
jgi:4-hydroxymandelate oxidase